MRSSLLILHRQRFHHNNQSWSNLTATTAVAISTAIGIAVTSYYEPQPKVTTTTRNDINASHDDDGDDYDDYQRLRRFSPYSPIRIFHPNPNLEIAFDVRTRNPVYVLERLVVNGNEQNASNNNNNKKRRPNFYEEKLIPEVFRSRNQNYHLSGYDRGHMAPAADFNFDQKQLLDTYNLINVSPQYHEINYKIWLRLEEWTRQIAYQYNTNTTTDKNKNNAGTRISTYVVTGPLWLPSQQVHEKLYRYNYSGIGIPPSLVSVPTHFYKIVAVIRDENEENASSIIQYACFVFPNDPSAQDWTLEDGLVRWSDLEAVTGLEFFPTIATKEWKKQADDRIVKPSVRLLPPRQQPLSNETSEMTVMTPPTTKNAMIKAKQARASVNHLCSNNSTCQIFKK